MVAVTIWLFDASKNSSEGSRPASEAEAIGTFDLNERVALSPAFRSKVLLRSGSMRLSLSVVQDNSLQTGGVVEDSKLTLSTLSKLNPGILLMLPNSIE